MADTAPPTSQRVGKFLERVSRTGTEYYKKGGYICDVCPYGSNKVCSTCMFARWNVDGVAAGFSPDKAYREAHKDDIVGSPMLQNFSMDAVDHRPREKTFRLPSVLGGQKITVRIPGLSPIELGSPGISKIPNQRTPYPGMPLPMVHDINEDIKRIHEVRRIIG